MKRYEFDQYSRWRHRVWGGQVILDFRFRFPILRLRLQYGLPPKTRDRKSCFVMNSCGLPLWYAAEVARRGAYKSAYVAHEVPTARALVESDPGHDTRFYNVMRQAQKIGLTMDEVFGDQSGFFKHAMLKTASV